MTDKEEFISIFKEKITREGADKLLDFLENRSDFFTAPASTRYHNAFEGGLLRHSLNVYHCLTAYLDRERVKNEYGLNVSDETAAVVALLFVTWGFVTPEGLGSASGTALGWVMHNLGWLFVLLAWRPASRAARSLVEDDNFAETWYVFWVLPLVFIGLNLFMIPRYRGTLYTGRVLQGYVVISLTLLLLLVLFYALFFMMASSLNKNARLQQENHFLSMQRARYDNLRAAIDEARQARHDLRHHFNRLAALAEAGDLAQIKAYLAAATGRIRSLDMHFCDNRAADSVIGYYCALAEREGIPFHARVDLPEKLPAEEIDLCLVLSNLLENALEANMRMTSPNRQISVEAYVHAEHLILIQVANPFDGEIREKHAVFQSSKRKGDGVGIQSVRRISEKNGGASTFTHDDGVFIAKVMLRG